MKNWLSPLCLFLLLAFGAHAQQQTPNGWSYDVLQPGTGPALTAQNGALTHNQLVDADGRILVSTYQINVPDYQRMSELDPAFQKAFSVMQEGGKYRFHIPVSDFKKAMRTRKPLNLPGNSVTWEMELVRVLPPLPDGARLVQEVFQKKGADAAHQEFQALLGSGKAFFGEWEVNQIGYLFLNEGRKQEALTAFQHNAKQHPDSANAFDSLAEAYYQNGNKAEARRCYQRSLELNPDNANARKMLSKLK